MKKLNNKHSKKRGRDKKEEEHLKEEQQTRNTDMLLHQLVSKMDQLSQSQSARISRWPSMPWLYLFSKAKAQSDDYEEPYTTTHWLTLGYYKLKYIESGAFLNKNSPFVKRVQFELHHKQFSIHHF